MELLFWILILAGWVALVFYGVTFLDKKIDKLLNLWFASEGYIKPRRPCYPCYLKNKTKVPKCIKS